MTEPFQPAVLPPRSFDFDTRYTNVIDVQFVSRALETGAHCIRGARWATQALYPSDAADVLATAYYEYNRSFEALVAIDGALAHVIRQGDTVTARLAARDQESLNRAERRLREELPEPETLKNKVPVEFAYWNKQSGPSVTTRTLDVPTLADIEMNYAAAVREQLRDLAAASADTWDGRLILWHGLPGCGKTWALRAIASEWRDWCTVRYITDPETLLNEPGYLVNLLHMRPGGRRDVDWRLIVMEDTGELLTADAKSQAGQGLSRLLNVVDGLLGESARALFLVTTNEDLRSIHPAVARPGRCAQLVEFDRLSADESNLWLGLNASTHRVQASCSLAELFALKAGHAVPAARRRPPGFV